MNTHRLNTSAKMGSKTNPFSNDAPGGADKANCYYFKAAYKGDGKTWTDDDLSQYTADGLRRGAVKGSTRDTKTDYTLPASALQANYTLARPDISKLPLEEANKVARKISVMGGLSVLKTLAPLLIVEVGGSEARKDKRKRTPDELKALAKSQGIKGDALFEFVTDENNMFVETTIPAVEPGKVLLSELIEKGGDISLSPGAVVQIQERIKEVTRDAMKYVGDLQAA